MYIRFDRFDEMMEEGCRPHQMKNILVNHYQVARHCSCAFNNFNWHL